MTGRTYNLTTWLWPDHGVIEIVDATGTRLATFSRQFLEIGHVLDWAFIQFACRSVVNEDGVIHRMQTGSMAEAADTIKTDELPSPGRYLYLRVDDSAAGCTWVEGPRFQYARRGPDGREDSSGTMSHSSRSTAQQNEFRNALYIRDGFCLLTDQPPGQAAHILPQSRPEYYKEVLGHDPVNYFNVAFGLLLKSDPHHAFDRGDWALFPSPSDPSVLIVHVFNDELSTSYHGKIITRERFRHTHSRELPHRQLLLFHYRQCLMKHIRGFEVFTSR